jgi:hypothetical protein
MDNLSKSLLLIGLFGVLLAAIKRGNAADGELPMDDSRQSDRDRQG